MQILTGQVVDILDKRVYPAVISIENKKIARIDPVLTETRIEGEIGSGYILPGFIDAHVHIESSMLIPSEFARLAVVHGTVGTVSDPHEIANVCGVAGVEFMITNGNSVPFKFNFGAPSCVPATNFETAGAVLDASEVSGLLKRKEIKYLSEMMNFPGVLLRDHEVLQKIEAAKRINKPVDGHAPGLRGEQARKYIEAGISTDHECFTREEALDKLGYGMKIIIREGSAAKNFEALIELLHEYPDKIMFCSDDKHPDSLVNGHINQLCARAVQKGIPLFNVLQAACINPVFHYKLDIGLLRAGDAADFIIVEDLAKFRVLQTYIDGELVCENGHAVKGRWQSAANSRQSAVSGQQSAASSQQSAASSQQSAASSQQSAVSSRQWAIGSGETGVRSWELGDDQPIINNFSCHKKEVADFIMPLSKLAKGNSFNEGTGVVIPVIEALEGQLITNKLLLAPRIVEGNIVSDTENDILKIVVVNRYMDAPVSIGFIKNFRLKQGAIASSVAHDSHNIVAVGTDDESLCAAVNLVIQEQGGISCVGFPSTPGIEPTSRIFTQLLLPLPVGGLMSTRNGYEVAEGYTAIDLMAKSLGCTLAAPFMTLSFMALLVIPHLKLSDKGLFDGDEFRLL